MQPMVSRDLMQFPVALPGEGVIDMVVQSNVRLLYESGSNADADAFYLDLSHAGTRQYRWRARGKAVLYG